MNLIKKLFRLGLCAVLVILVLKIGNVKFSDVPKLIGFDTSKSNFSITKPDIKKPDISSNNTKKSEKVKEDKPAQTTSKKEDTKEKPKNKKETKKKTDKKTNPSNITKKQIDDLIKQVKVSKSTNKNKYNRNDFEKPVKYYKLNGKSYSRHDYAWKTSQYLISEKPFKYKCPYTNDIITDEKILDFEHIISLHYVFLYNTNWTKEKMNEYAYNQDIGVDVLNKANRSKSDKGPADWLPDVNQEDFCYTWLIIAKEWDIALRQEDINTCKLIIYNAIDSGEKIERLN